MSNECVFHTSVCCGKVNFDYFGRSVFITMRHRVFQRENVEVFLVWWLSATVARHGVRTKREFPWFCSLFSLCSPCWTSQRVWWYWIYRSELWQKTCYPFGWWRIFFGSSVLCTNTEFDLEIQIFMFSFSNSIDILSFRNVTCPCVTDLSSVARFTSRDRYGTINLCGDDR